MKTLIYLIGIILLLSLVLAAPAQIQNLRICDTPGDRIILDRVKVCSASNLLVVVNSTESLKLTNAKPYYDSPKGLTFLYSEPSPNQPKQIRVVLTKNLDSQSKYEMPLGTFAGNMLAGQGLVVILDNEFYLINYSHAETRYSSSKLQMWHLPTIRYSEPKNYAGTSWYLFEVLGQRKIALGTFGGTLVIQSLTPGEAPAAYVTPLNLVQRYEVSFTKDTPIRVTDPNLGTFAICQDDNARDREQVKVCRDNQFVFTLKANSLTANLINAQDYVFLFEMMEQPAVDTEGNSITNVFKQVSLFQLTELGVSSKHLDYDNFINSLVEGRRLAFKFDGNLYLASHPVTDYFSLPLLKFTAYKDNQLVNVSTAGTESQIEVPVLNGGKIFVKRNYGTPPPPFDIWAKKRSELQPVNLERDLFTSFSSESPVTFDTTSTSPPFGTVSVRDGDIKFSSPVFKIKTTGLGAYAKNLDLDLNHPQEVSGTLFYYYSANMNLGLPIKTAYIYKLYTLTPNTNANAPNHVYDDEFIRTITGGKELVLKFGESYYRLGHQNNPAQAVFFDLGKLVLKNLNGTTLPSPTKEEPKKISFIVPEGKILVKIDESTLPSKIYFQAQTQQALETLEFPAEDVETKPRNYSIILTPSNTIRVDGVELKMCNLDLYAYLPAADICYGQEELLVRNLELLSLVWSPSLENEPNKHHYLLETNGRTGSEKRVTIRKIFEPTTQGTVEFQNEDWNEVAKHLIAGDQPLINVSNTLYLPVTSDNLLSHLSWQAYPAGDIYPLKNVEEITPVSFNGSFVLKDKVIFAHQVLGGTAATQRIVNFDFTLKDYTYLPDSQNPVKVNQTANVPLEFITSLNGDIYQLTALEINEKVVRLELKTREQVTIFNKYFAEDDVRSLTLDGVPVQIKIEKIHRLADQVELSVIRK